MQHCEERCGYNSEYVIIEGKNTMTSSIVMDMKMMCVQEDVTKYKGGEAGLVSQNEAPPTWIAAICDSFFMVGYFIGGVIFGTVADAHGR